MVKIVQKDDPVLRKIAKPVANEMFGTPGLNKIIRDMKTALGREDDGVALAAPQIGVSLCIFVVSGKVMEILHPDSMKNNKKYPDIVFINPKIIKFSRDREILEEGCLSLRYLYGKIERAKKARIRAFDEKGKEFEIGTAGLLAQIFQHETDHLLGKLFTDHATDVHDMPPKNEKTENEKPPNIAFFGTPDRAVIVLETLKQSGIVPKLIITQPDRPQGRKLIVTPPAVKIWAQREKIPFLQPENLEDQTFIQTLREGNFDVFVVVAYGKILRQNILDIPKHGCLNLHASLLPKLRGSSPIETAILIDEKKIGVTIILMDSLMDHGPIVAQREVELSSWPVSSEELAKILLESGAELMAHTIPLWLDGKIKPREQNHAEATITKRIKKEDGSINLSDDHYDNYLKFLAFKKWPTTYFFLEKDKKKIRVIITDAIYENGLFVIKKVIPEGKRETSLLSLYPRQTP